MMGDLLKRWAVFLVIVLDPWTIVLLISIGGLFWLSYGEENSKISTLLFVLITLTSAILGGRITSRWVDIIEGGTLIARGKSAVRSLKLLLRNISSLEKRVGVFLTDLNESEKHLVVTKRNYEEVQETCNLLEEETVNSIENWTDIVPEADIKTQIGVISDLKLSLRRTEAGYKSLKTELENTEEKSVKEQEQLEKKLQERANEISELNSRIFRKSLDLNVLGGISLSEYEDDRRIVFSGVEHATPIEFGDDKTFKITLKKTEDDNS